MDVLRPQIRARSRLRLLGGSSVCSSRHRRSNSAGGELSQGRVDSPVAADPVEERADPAPRIGVSVVVGQRDLLLRDGAHEVVDVSVLGGFALA